MGSIVVRQVSYIHAGKEPLFQNVSFTIAAGDKVALVGNNGTGKSTLLQMMAGVVEAVSGEIFCPVVPYYIPQHVGQYDEMTVMEALRVEMKVRALHRILGGDASVDNFSILDDDWEIEDRSRTALNAWELSHVELTRQMSMLSGGEKTRVFLAGIDIHNPSVILLDEPTNHLDKWSREKLYDFIKRSGITILVVSHDRTLLNLLPVTLELDKGGITLYGGNYEFYKSHKDLKISALQRQVGEKEKELRQARKIAREAAERQQKRDVRGEKQNAKKGVPRILMGGLKNKAERSFSKLNEVHAGKMDVIAASLSESRAALPGLGQMKVDFNSSVLHDGRVLITAKEVNFRYGGADVLWEPSLSFQIKSGERIALGGRNGSGKTTLLELMLGQLVPTEGEMIRTDFKYVVVDQACSMIRDDLMVYGQAEQFNLNHFPEYELKMRLNRFLFPSDSWDKSCGKLSGGERMRLMFCCLMIANSTPDLFVLDEPTNNLDIQNVEIITSVIKDYRGTVIVVSHDRRFVEEIGVEREIELP